MPGISPRWELRKSLAAAARLYSLGLFSSGSSFIDRTIRDNVASVSLGSAYQIASSDRSQFSSSAVGMDGPSRFAFPPHSCWRTLNVGNPPPQRLTEYMLVVTTSVATAATDTAAVPVSSSQSVILIVFRIHAQTVRPRSPIGLLHTGGFPSRRLLVADSLICCSHLIWTAQLITSSSGGSAT